MKIKRLNAETQRGGAATETECSRPRLQQRAAGGRLVNNPAHSGLRMLLRPGTGALRPILRSLRGIWGIAVQRTPRFAEGGNFSCHAENLDKPGHLLRASPRLCVEKTSSLQPLAFSLQPSQRGVALVITLILLSVVTFMAITFLALSRRERSAVTTVTDTASARLAADAALANAEAQVIANVLATTNPFSFGLLVSTNYINRNGFQTAPATAYTSLTNVNYQYPNGNPLNAADFLQNLINLYYSPRPPVFIPTNSAGANDFRFYLDLNRNGRFDANGLVINVVDNAGNSNGVISEVGDPEWIGVLERPDAPYGPNNKFIARYAFIALPVGNTLDLNAIHNQAHYFPRPGQPPANWTVNPPVNNPGNPDSFIRNEGVGSWEINLAAFLADLNTNEWDNSISGIYQYPPSGLPGPFAAFDDARALLAYRYNDDFRSLATVNNLFPSGLLDPFNWDNIDGYTYGQPLFGTVGFQLPGEKDSLLYTYPWVGADNTNHFFTHQDLFNTSDTALGVPAAQMALNNYFTYRLLQAGTNIFGGSTVSTYDRYTFYRLLSQLGTDSAPDSGKMNLNYDNVNPYLLIGGVEVPSTNGVAASTNFVAWQPLAFFTNAADRLLRAYTTQWRNSNPTKFATTFYAVNNFNFDATNFASYPAFGVGNIPVLVSNRFVYSSAVNRLLQLAANMYDATTNNTFALGNDYPSVFRPLFSRDAGGTGTNVFISGYQQIISVVDAINPPLDPPVDIQFLSTMSGSVSNLAVNVYGVPWIIGAKKGFPNFNEFTMQNVVQVERKLQVTRQTIAGAITTNQMYIFSISNSLGAELWNSYNSNYVGQIQVQRLVRDNISMVLTNDAPGFSAPQIINGGFTNTFSTNLWSGSEWSSSYPQPNGQPQASSFFIPLNPTVSTVVLLTNSVYDYSSSTVPGYAWPCFIPQFLDPSNFLDTGISQLPHFGLLTTNRLQVIIIDGIHVIDYAHFAGPNSSRDLNNELQDPYSVGDPAYMWNTNAYLNSSKPYGVVNQINVSRGLANLPSNAGGIWDTTYAPLEQPFFDAFFYKGNPKQLSPPMHGVSSVVNTNLSQQVPFSPVRIISEFISWQANDPLVHYLASDLNYSGQDTKPPTGISQWNSTASPLPRPTFGILNNLYQPWGRTHMSTNSDPNPYNFTLKDPLMWQSDNWDFPANKFPTIGWLGRVHRGTPWQTVYLKATDLLDQIQIIGTPPIATTNYIGRNTWMTWMGNGNSLDATNTAPAQDRLLFDLFTTAFNDNATRGTLSVNQNHLAVWSALFSGIVVPPVSPTNTYSVIAPAGPAGLNSPLGYLVQNGTNGINDIRANTNLFPQRVFMHVGDILTVPALTERSPFLNPANTSYNNDEMYEWLPQQTMSLLRCTGSPRYVIYCYGQALKPAPNSIYTGGDHNGAYFGMVTNYQVVSEIATRAVVRFGSSLTNVITSTNSVVGGILYSNWFSIPVVTNNNAVIESFNILPPD